MAVLRMTAGIMISRRAIIAVSAFWCVIRLCK